MALTLQVVGIGNDEIFGNIADFKVTRWPAGAVNQLDYIDLMFSTLDPNCLLLLAPHPDEPRTQLFTERELRLSNGTNVLFEGPPRHFQSAGPGWMKCRVYSFAWWLARRVGGRADRQNLVTNGDFEGDSVSSPPSDWTATGTTATVVSSPTAVGNRAVKLDGAGYIEQTFAFPSGVGLGPQVAFRVRTDGTNFPAPIPDTPNKPPVWAQMSADDQPGVWNKLELDAGFPADQYREVVAQLGRSLPPGGTYNVTVRIYGSAGGDMYVDDIRAAQPESVGATYLTGSDPANVGSFLIDYFQDVAHGKDDVGITGVAHATGETMFTVWQDRNHVEFLEMVRQITDRGDCDWWCDYGQREIHFGPRGDLWPTWRLDTDVNFTVDDDGLIIDGTTSARSAITMGPAGGEGAESNEGGFIADAPGPIMEVVEHLDESVDLQEYDRIAQQAATENALPVVQIRGTVNPPPEHEWSMFMVSVLRSGDRVPVRVVNGHLTIESDEARILELAPDWVNNRIRVLLSVTA